MPPEGTVVAVKRKLNVYTQPEDDIIIAGAQKKLSWTKVTEQVSAHNAASNNGVTRSYLSVRQRWHKTLKKANGPGAHADAGNAGEEQGKDTMVEDKEDGPPEEVIREEDSDKAETPKTKRNGSLAWRVELELATNKHNHEMEKLKKQGLAAEEDPQILREASLEREMKRYALEKQRRGGN